LAAVKNFSFWKYCHICNHKFTFGFGLPWCNFGKNAPTKQKHFLCR